MSVYFLTKKDITFLNQLVPVSDLLNHFYGIQVSVNHSFRCPYHDDRIKSARLYEDNSFFCFACQQQFSPYRILRLEGYTPHHLKILLEEYRAQSGIPPSLSDSRKGSRYNIPHLQFFAKYAREQFKQGMPVLQVVDAWIQFCKSVLRSSDKLRSSNEVDVR